MDRDMVPDLGELDCPGEVVHRVVEVPVLVEGVGVAVLIYHHYSHRNQIQRGISSQLLVN